MKHVEVPDVGVSVHFPSISIHAALKHHSVSVEFERKTEVNDAKKCHHAPCCFLLLPVFRHQTKRKQKQKFSSIGNGEGVNHLF